MTNLSDRRINHHQKYGLDIGGSELRVLILQALEEIQS
jgi:hypothetical protein